MLSVSVYSGNPARFLGVVDIIGHKILTPKIAKLVLSEVGQDSGTVFQDMFQHPDLGFVTVAYRVYRGGRTRRTVWPMIQSEVEHSAEYDAVEEEIRKEGYSSRRTA